MVQLSHPYITTGKTIALTIWTFVSKVMSLLLNTLSRFVIAFLKFVYLFGCDISSLWHTRSLLLHTRSFSCGIRALSCSLWDMVSWPGIKSGPPELGVWSLSHWTTREVPVIAFIPENDRLLISWLQLPSTVIFELKKKKSVTVPFFSPSICHEVMGLDAMILVFWMLSFKPAFSQYTALMYSFPNFEPVHCFMSSSNCYFLTCIQVS